MGNSNSQVESNDFNEDIEHIYEPFCCGLYKRENKIRKKDVDTNVLEKNEFRIRNDYILGARNLRINNIVEIYKNYIPFLEIFPLALTPPFDCSDYLLKFGINLIPNFPNLKEMLLFFNSEINNNEIITDPLISYYLIFLIYHLHLFPPYFLQEEQILNLKNFLLSKFDSKYIYIKEKLQNLNLFFIWDFLHIDENYLGKSSIGHLIGLSNFVDIINYHLNVLSEDFKNEINNYVIIIDEKINKEFDQYFENNISEHLKHLKILDDETSLYLISKLFLFILNSNKSQLLKDSIQILISLLNDNFKNLPFLS